MFFPTCRFALGSRTTYLASIIFTILVLLISLWPLPTSLPVILSGYTALAAPYPPSPVKDQDYYSGIPSHPLLESSSIRLHPLQLIWEATVGPALVNYLDSKGVKRTSLDPVRMRHAGESSPPVIVWMGVVPGSLSAKDGVEVATQCKSILSAHDIGDVHVEIRESEVDSNELYQHRSSSQRHRNVLLFGDAAIEKHITAIEPEIGGKHIIIKHLESRLEYREQMDEEDAKAKRNQVRSQLEGARKAIRALEKFLADVSRDWKKRENRVLGYVVLSPPHRCRLDLSNFLSNVIDLGTTIPVDEFPAWMSPRPANPPSLKHSGNHLLKFYSTISDEEMWKPSPKTLDHDHDPCIMVIKRGYASDLTVGRINTIHLFTRVYFKGQPGQVSKEVTALPRNSKSGAFSGPGDSGSAVVDGKGRFVGLLTGGAGVTEVSDCTYLTSTNFLLMRMFKHGLRANLSPSSVLK
ncbi:hypothetical protein BJV74DRAFT_882269 [Russula compacta]|nr:hypothetical protein BJV74DRAFT_882269 [Russula compacta]